MARHIPATKLRFRGRRLAPGHVVNTHIYPATSHPERRSHSLKRWSMLLVVSLRTDCYEEPFGVGDVPATDWILWY